MVASEIWFAYRASSTTMLREQGLHILIIQRIWRFLLGKINHPYDRTHRLLLLTTTQSINLYETISISFLKKRTKKRHYELSSASQVHLPVFFCLDELRCRTKLFLTFDYVATSSVQLLLPSVTATNYCRCSNNDLYWVATHSPRSYRPAGDGSSSRVRLERGFPASIGWHTFGKDAFVYCVTLCCYIGKIYNFFCKAMNSSNVTMSDVRWHQLLQSKWNVHTCLLSVRQLRSDCLP